MTNLLVAIKKLVDNPVTDIRSHYESSNRANSMGDALECYVKDLFCGSATVDDTESIDELYSRHFSYLGNQNNPPDFIIQGGDAIEVKKIEGLRSGLALNSSYPKDKLHTDSPMITEECRNCEDWIAKDLIYTIGVANDNVLKALWFVYGDCYAADKEVYERIKEKISTGLDELEGIELSDTKELGRVNKVDPLGITNLRIRGMWHIENPIKVFREIIEINSDDQLSVNALMLNEKYMSFPESDRSSIEGINNEGFVIRDVRIKSPNNPANLLDAKLISFSM